MAVNVLSLCHVRETSPGTHTFFPTYTCPVYCWRSVQLLDFGLYCNLIHASQPIRTTFTGQWFASSFLQTPPHDDALAFGCTLPTAGRVRDFHPLERVPAGHTTILLFHTTMKKHGFIIVGFASAKQSSGIMGCFIYVIILIHKFHKSLKKIFLFSFLKNVLE